MDILWLPTIYSDPNSSKDKVSDRKRRSTSLVVSWGELQLLDQNYSGTMFANGEVDITVKYLFLTNLSTLPQKTVRFLTYQWIQFTMKFFFLFFLHSRLLLFVLLANRSPSPRWWGRKRKQPQTRAKGLGSFDSTRPVQELPNRNLLFPSNKTFWWDQF